MELFLSAKQVAGKCNFHMISKVIWAYLIPFLIQ